MWALELKDLVKVYSNGTKAIKGIDLKVSQSDFFGLLGPNGAGKSTIIGILSSLVTKTSGKISILGHDIDLVPETAKSFIGVVPQEINLGIFEQVIDIVINQAGFYGVDRKTAHIRAEKYLTLLKLWEKRNSIARNLSGGMKRRLMIARALIHEPEILILDEPTAGVDIEIRHSMWKFLQELNNSGKTIILTTHYLEEAEHLCKNLAIINEGQIIENGTMKNILQKLKKETFILDLEEEIKQTPSSINKNIIEIIDSKTIEITITEGSENLGEVVTQLTAQGIKIKSMRNKQNRLEKFFLQITQESGLKA